LVIDAGDLGRLIEAVNSVVRVAVR